MWREPLGRALTRQTDGVNPTILDDPLDAQGGRAADCELPELRRHVERGERDEMAGGALGPDRLESDRAADGTITLLLNPPVASAVAVPIIFLVVVPPL
jgi:hypothetical protein